MGEEKIWVVTEEQSLLAKKGVFFRISGIGLNVALVGSTWLVLLSLSEHSGLGLANPVPFLSTPRQDCARARPCAPPAPAADTEVPTRQPGPAPCK